MGGEAASTWMLQWMPYAGMIVTLANARRESPLAADSVALSWQPRSQYGAWRASIPTRFLERTG
jgi:hypothetical protein